MQLIVYAIAYPLLWLFSNLPMRILFVFSDLVYYLLYYLLGYRKKVVRNNLALAFPDKTKSELREIEKRSYRHFVDVFFEMIKSFTISEKEISKRLSITNPELLDPYYAKGQSVIFTSGHYANWEWVSFIVEKSLNYHMSVVYKKLKNKYFDNLMKKTRNKFGVRFVEKRNFYPEILKNKKEGIIQAYGFLSDQSPKLKTAKYWDTFLNVEVPVEIGPETIARKMNYPVFYFQTEQVKRGVYQSTFLLLEEEPKKARPNAITKSYLKALEDQIHKKPEFYFWTHKRFKHMRGKSL
jgi:KDO2-lipid IV(A) lauroyltransferase